MPKKTKTESDSPSIAKMLLPSVASGLLVGSAKGYSERGLESAFKKLFQRRAVANALRKMKAAPSQRAPWALARGITSGLSAIPYTLSAVLAAKELGKGKKST